MPSYENEVLPLALAADFLRNNGVATDNHKLWRRATLKRIPSYRRGRRFVFLRSDLLAVIARGYL